MCSFFWNVFICVYFSPISLFLPLFLYFFSPLLRFSSVLLTFLSFVLLTFTRSHIVTWSPITCCSSQRPKTRKWKLLILACRNLWNVDSTLQKWRAPVCTLYFLFSLSLNCTFVPCVSSRLRRVLFLFLLSSLPCVPFIILLFLMYFSLCTFPFSLSPSLLPHAFHLFFFSLLRGTRSSFRAL